MYIRLFGAFAIVAASQPLTIATSKTRMLLAWLLAHPNKPQQRRALAAMFWPDLDGARGLHNVRMALTFLRPMLQHASQMLAIGQHTLTYVPQPDVSCDAAAFEQLIAETTQHQHRTLERCPHCAALLERALALYAGDYLAGEQFVETTDLTPWLDAERRRYAHKAQHARWVLAQFHRHVQHYDTARDFLQRYLIEAPNQEEAHVLMMELYMHKNQRAAAMAQALLCTQMLLQEFKTTPAPATQRLIESIHAQTWHPPDTTPVVAPPRLSFHGRERELGHIATLLSTTTQRLISIVGTGGVGKTTLARFVGASYASLFANGAIFVALEQITDSAAAIRAIGRALGAQFTGSGTLIEQLCDVLVERELLLILDNCEQLTHDCSFVTRLVNECRGVTILCTTRVPLQFTYEACLPLYGLDVNDDPATNPAVALFIDRAQQRNVTRDYTAERQTIAEICVLLGGLPLAIELAAGISQSHTCAAVLAMIKERTGVLSSELRDTPDRHRQVTVLFEEIWQGLSVAQRAFLHAATVFPQSFDQNAVLGLDFPAVLQTDVYTTLQTLHSLVTAALIQHEHGRYIIHPFLRLAIVEQTEPLSHALRDAHRNFFLKRLQRPELHVLRTQSIMLAEELAGDMPNILAAWAWGTETRMEQDVCAAARALHIVAICLGYVPTVADLFRDTATELGSIGVRVCLLTWESKLRYRLGEYTRVAETAAYVIAHATGAQLVERATAATMLSVAETSTGATDETLARLHAIAKEIPADAQDIAADVALYTGVTYLMARLGAYQTAMEYFTEAYARYTTIDDLEGMAYCVIMFAYRGMIEGNLPLAIELLEDTLVKVTTTRNRRYMAMLQSHLSFLDVVMGRLVEPAIETLHECIEALVAVGDRASEMEARQVLFRLYIVTQRYAAAGAFLRTNKERILAFGNPMQQLLFADAIGYAYFLREEYTEALGVSFYVLELPSLHAMYRQERMPLVDATLARVSAEIHEAAQEHAARLRALPLHTAMDALMSLFIRVTEQG